MSTIPDQQAGTRRRRRIHSEEFKANAVASCMRPGMSMAAVAMVQGVDANLLRRWVRDAEMNFHNQSASRLYVLLCHLYMSMSLYMGT